VVLPLTAGANGRDGWARNAKVGGELAVRDIGRGRSYRTNLRERELGRVVRGPRPHSQTPTHDRVVRVVGVSADHQVRRIAARRAVAPVAHNKTGRRVAVRAGVGKSVRKFLAGAGADTAVPKWRPVTLPLPAGVVRGHRQPGRETWQCICPTGRDRCGAVWRGGRHAGGEGRGGGGCSAAKGANFRAARVSGALRWIARSITRGYHLRPQLGGQSVAAHPWSRAHSTPSETVRSKRRLLGSIIEHTFEQEVSARAVMVLSPLQDGEVPAGHGRR